MIVNVLDHAQVPIAAGAIRSGGRDLLPGELVEQFWAWPKHIQDMTLRERKVVMVSAADAQRAQERAAEVRARTQVKETKAEASGLQAEIAGLDVLIKELSEKHAELVQRRNALQAQLNPKLAEIIRLENDPSIMPEDEETQAASMPPQTDLEIAAGLKMPTEEIEEPPVFTPPTPAPVLDEPVLSPEEIAMIRAWAAKLTYKELQAEAARFGLSFVGIKRAVLEATVGDAMARQHAAEKAAPEA